MLGISFCQVLNLGPLRGSLRLTWEKSAAASSDAITYFLCPHLSPQPMYHLLLPWPLPSFLCHEYTFHFSYSVNSYASCISQPNRHSLGGFLRNVPPAHNTHMHTYTHTQDPPWWSLGTWPVAPRALPNQSLYLCPFSNIWFLKEFLVVSKPGWESSKWWGEPSCLTQSTLHSMWDIDSQLNWTHALCGGSSGLNPWTTGKSEKEPSRKWQQLSPIKIWPRSGPECETWEGLSGLVMMLCIWEALLPEP